MRTTARMLAMAGMALLVGATIGVGPAQAAPATGQINTGSSADQRHGRWGDEEIVGYYRNMWMCERAGRIGERFGAWDDYDCERVRWGSRRGAWALVVEEDHWDNGWDDRWRPGHWPGSWPNRPHWPGSGNWQGGGHR